MLVIKADAIHAVIESGGIIPSGTVGAKQARFDLTDDWNGYTVTAQFSGGGNTVDVANIQSGESVVIPWECLEQPGPLKITLYGIDGNKRMPVIYTFATVVDSGVSEGSEPAAPTPTAYEQFVNEVSGYCSDAYSYAQAAGDAQSSASSLALEVAADKENADESAGAAALSAAAAEISAALAQSYATGNSYRGEGTLNDNAKYYCEQAKSVHDDMQQFIIYGELNSSAPYADDVSRTAHKLELITQPNARIGVYGKNLFDHTLYAYTGETVNGLTFSCGTDGFLSVSGTQTAATTKASALVSDLSTLDVFPAGTYTFGCKSISGNPNVHPTLKCYTPGGTSLGNKVGTFTVAEPFIIRGWYVYFNSGNVGATMNATLYPQLECLNTATGFEPYRTPAFYTADANGVCNSIDSDGPSMSIICGSEFSCKYRRDMSIVFNRLLDAISRSGGGV